MDAAVKLLALRRLRITTHRWLTVANSRSIRSAAARTAAAYLEGLQQEHLSCAFTSWLQYEEPIEYEGPFAQSLALWAQTASQEVLTEIENANGQGGLFDCISTRATSLLSLLHRITQRVWVGVWVDAAVGEIEPQYMKMMELMPRAMLCGRKFGWSKAKCGIRGARIEIQLKKDGQWVAADRAEAAVTKVMQVVQQEKKLKYVRGAAMRKALACMMADSGTAALITAMHIWSSRAITEHEAEEEQQQTVEEKEEQAVEAVDPSESERRDWCTQHSSTMLHIDSCVSGHRSCSWHTTLTTQESLMWMSSW